MKWYVSGQGVLGRSFQRFLGFYNRASRFKRTLDREKGVYEASMGRDISPSEFETIYRYLSAKQVEYARGWFLVIPVYIVLGAAIVVAWLLL